MARVDLPVILFFINIVQDIILVDAIFLRHLIDQVIAALDSFDVILRIQVRQFPNIYFIIGRHPSES